jgi:hypothetical protein
MSLSTRSPWARAGRRTPATPGPRRNPRPALECLEGRVVPSVTINAAGLVSVVGTPGNDNFVIRLQQGSPTNIQFSDDGGGSFTTFALSDVTGVNVRGLAGNDRLVLDSSNGLVGAATKLPITFDGGTGFNTLVLQGNPPDGAADLTYTVGPAAFSGTVTAANGTASSAVTFTHVGSVRDTLTAATLTVNADDNPNLILVTDGPTVGGTRTTTVQVFDRVTPAHGGGDNGDEGGDQGNDGGQGDQGDDDHGNGGDDRGEGDDRGRDHDRHLVEARAFAPISFANAAQVTVNGLGGNDFFVLANPHAAAGLTSLTLDGGPGTDVAVELAVPAGVTVTTPNVEKVITDPDDAFIEDAFLERLGRDADSGGLHFWEGVMKSGGRSAVLLGIEDSLEGRDAFVRQLYVHLLGRDAAGGEELFWVNQLLGGSTEEQVEAGILGSAEFRALAQGMGSASSADERFVQALYQTLLGRQAAPSESQFWAAADKLSGDGAVAGAILGSAELRTDVVTADYQSLLGRDPDAAGLNLWVFSGLDLGHVRDAIEASSEFAHGH